MTISDFIVQFCVGMAPISPEKSQVYAEESIAEAFRSAAARGHMGRGVTGLGGGDQIGAEIAAVEAAASRIIQRYHPGVILAFLSLGGKPLNKEKDILEHKMNVL